MKKSLPIEDFPPTKGYINPKGGPLEVVTGNEHRINSQKLSLKDGWAEQQLVALERSDEKWDVFSLHREDSPGKGRPFTLRHDFSLVQAGVSKAIAVESIQAHDIRSKSAATAPAVAPN